MTFDEALKLAKVIETADGGCPSCVMSLAEALSDAFPDYIWEFDEEADDRGDIQVNVHQGQAANG